MTNALHLRFVADADGTGELFAKVQVGGFSGEGSAWFGVEELVAFAHQLEAAYPLPAEAALKLEGGFWSESGSTVEQLHVGLQFYPISSLGSVACRVSLASQVSKQCREGSQASVTVELRTNYEPLRSFARSLEMLAKGTVNEAVLEAEG